MVSYEYKLACSETLDILKHTNDDDVKKIPEKFMNFLKSNSLKTYNSKLDFNKSLKEMNLNSKTIGILSIIYKKYWCNDEQRKAFEDKLRENEIKYREQLRKNFQTNTILAKEYDNIEKSNNNAIELIEKNEENWIKKIIKKIKCFFEK